MKIEQLDGWLNVELTVVELKGLYLKYFHSYEYLCPVVHVVAKMRHRKKSFETIDQKLRGRNDDGPYECDRVVSANTCYQMLKLAGLSKRGMIAFRHELRTRGFILKSGMVVGSSDFSMHAILDSMYEPFNDRMVALGTSLLSDADMGYDSDVAYRIGVLTTVAESNPEFICKFRFPI